MEVEVEEAHAISRVVDSKVNGELVHPTALGPSGTVDRVVTTADQRYDHEAGTDRHLKPHREFVEGVTFAEFRELVARLGWTAEELAQRFAGKFGGPADSAYYERPLGYFQRVLAQDKGSEDRAIPYRCVIELYVAITQLELADPTRRLVTRRCACGCGSPAWGRNRFAARSCLERSRQAKPVVEGLGEVTDHVGDPFLAPGMPSQSENGASENSRETKDDLRDIPRTCPEIPGLYGPICEECGKALLSIVKRRPRRFCKERCRKRAARRLRRPT